MRKRKSSSVPKLLKDPTGDPDRPWLVVLDGERKRFHDHIDAAIYVHKKTGEIIGQKDS